MRTRRRTAAPRCTGQSTAIGLSRCLRCATPPRSGSAHADARGAAGCVGDPARPRHRPGAQSLQMWKGGELAPSWCTEMWHGRARSWYRSGRGEPSPGADGCVDGLARLGHSNHGNHGYSWRMLATASLRALAHSAPTKNLGYLRGTVSRSGLSHRCSGATTPML